MADDERDPFNVRLEEAEARVAELERLVSEGQEAYRLLLAERDLRIIERDAWRNAVEQVKAELQHQIEKGKGSASATFEVTVSVKEKP